MRELLICLVLVLCAQSAGAESLMESFEYHVNTTGNSGPMCGRRKCLTEHACVAGSCECPEGSQGDARLQCAQGGAKICSVTADPHVHAFGGARVDVDLPCRYPVARLHIPVGPQGSKFAGCMVEVHAINSYADNKFYVTEVDVDALLVDYASTDTQFRSSIFAAIFGVGINGQGYQYSIFGEREEGFQSYDARNNSLYMNLTLSKPTDDQDNNIMTMAIEKCGLGVHFRAADFTTEDELHMFDDNESTVPGHMSQLPGFSMQVPPNAYTTENGTLLCGTPGDLASLWADRAAELGLDDPKLAVIHDILVVDMPWQEVGLETLYGGHVNSDVCDYVIDYLDEAVGPDPTYKASLINLCGPILTNKDIRACVGAEVEDYLYEEGHMWGFLACIRAANGELSVQCRFTKNIAVDKCGLPWSGETLQCLAPGDD